MCKLTSSVPGAMMLSRYELNMLPLKAFSKEMDHCREYIEGLLVASKSGKDCDSTI